MKNLARLCMLVEYLYVVKIRYEILKPVSIHTMTIYVVGHIKMLYFERCEKKVTDQTNRNCRLMNKRLAHFSDLIVADFENGSSSWKKLNHFGFAVSELVNCTQQMIFFSLEDLLANTPSYGSSFMRFPPFSPFSLNSPHVKPAGWRSQIDRLFCWAT